MSMSEDVAVNYYVKLGAEIRKLRKSKGMTLKQAAELAGITFTFLSDLERGRVAPSLNTLSAIGQGWELNINVLPDWWTAAEQDGQP